MASLRICRACKTEKPPEDYYPDRLNGRQRTACKKCESAAAHARQIANRESTRARNRRYYAEHAGRIRARVRDPRKELARSKVRVAVRAGRIRKPDDCGRCGLPTPRHRLHAHHDDYDKPFEVIWLCASCHRGLHAKT